MPARIGPKKPFRLFIAEWREEKGLTQQQVAEALQDEAMQPVLPVLVVVEVLITVLGSELVT